MPAIYRAAQVARPEEEKIRVVLAAAWDKVRTLGRAARTNRLSPAALRRALLKLDADDDAKISQILGPEKFAARDRYRADPRLSKAGRAAEADYPRQFPDKPVPAPASSLLWPASRCASAAATLRSTVVDLASFEQTHIWVHEYARHC